MKKRLMSWLLAVVMLLGLLPAAALPAAAASGPNVVTAKLTAGQELANNTIYLVTEDTDITAANDQNGLKVAAGAKAVLYIASGVTLHVMGGNASSNAVGGKAGILLPASSTLTVTGQGTLVVNGGSGAKAGDGTQGTVGAMSQVDVESGNDPTKGNCAFDKIITVTFQGGNGGHGASGGGAAIGTDGGVGGAGGSYSYLSYGEGSSQMFNGQKSSDNGIIYNNRTPDSAKAGANGTAGGSVDKAGKLFIVGSVKVTATGGTGGAAGSAAAERTVRENITFCADARSDLGLSQAKHHTGCLIRMEMGKDSGKDIDWATFCIGPGGPGGGGGAGGSGAAIGTGGGGGGGDGGGGLSATDKSDSNNEADKAASAYGSGGLEAGHGGGGGSANGAAGGSDRSGEFGLHQKGKNSWSYRLVSANGGSGGSGGSNGTEIGYNTTGFVIAEGASVNGHTGTSNSERVQPDVAYHTFTLNKNNGEGGSSSAEVVFGTNEGTKLTAPTRTGYNFQGYSTAASGGTKLYNADGTPANALRPFTNTAYLGQSELFAQWQAITYTIEYYTPDGGTRLSSQTVSYGSTFQFAGHPANPSVPSGKKFTGWSPYLYGSTAIYKANATARNLSSTQGDVLKFYAVYEDIPDHTVTYDANGGSGAPRPTTVKHNTSYTISSIEPTRENYTFLGWSTNPRAENADYLAGHLTNVSADLTLYAVWKHNPSVSYDANGGYFTTSMPIDYPEVGKAYTVSGSVPTREGYTFTGWNTKRDGSGTSLAAGGTLDIENYSDITLYAQWEVINYQITVTAAEGVSVTQGLQGGCPYGSDRPFEVSGTGTIRVYANGVLLSPQSDGKYHVTVTQDIDIVITRTEPAEQYIVSYHPNGGHDAPRDDGAYPSGTDAEVLGQGGMFRTGWTFTGWNTRRDGQGDAYAAGADLTVTADTVLYAQWRANRYSVRYDPNGGDGTMDATDMTYGTEGTISPCTFTREGYRFAGWARSADGFPVYRGNDSVLNLTEEDGAAITLCALWTAEEYTLTLDAMGGAPAKSYAKATYDAPLPGITLPTRTGYVFAGFFDGNGVRYYNANGTAAVNAWSKTGDAALIARWTPIAYQVRYDANANDAAGTMDSTDMTYDNGGALAPNAFTRAGRTFLGWALTPTGGVVYEDGTSIQNLTAEQGGTVTLYAVWSAKRTYQITYDAGTTDTVLNLPGGGEKVHCESYTLSGLSPVRAGYDFKGWLGSDSNPYQPGGSYDADAALTLTAQWEPKTYTLTLNDGGIAPSRSSAAAVR